MRKSARSCRGVQPASSRCRSRQWLREGRNEERGQLGERGRHFRRVCQSDLSQRFRASVRDHSPGGTARRRERNPRESIAETFVIPHHRASCRATLSAGKRKRRSSQSARRTRSSNARPSFEVRALSHLSLPEIVSSTCLARQISLIAPPVVPSRSVGRVGVRSKRCRTA